VLGALDRVKLGREENMYGIFCKNVSYLYISLIFSQFFKG
jgi:hypothetical protein